LATLVTRSSNVYLDLATLGGCTFAAIFATEDISIAVRPLVPRHGADDRICACSHERHEVAHHLGLRLDGERFAPFEVE